MSRRGGSRDIPSVLDRVHVDEVLLLHDSGDNAIIADPRPSVGLQTSFELLNLRTGERMLSQGVESSRDVRGDRGVTRTIRTHRLSTPLSSSLSKNGLRDEFWGPWGEKETGGLIDRPVNRQRRLHSHRIPSFLTPIKPYSEPFVSVME